MWSSSFPKICEYSSRAKEILKIITKENKISIKSWWVRRGSRQAVKSYASDNDSKKQEGKAYHRGAITMDDYALQLVKDIQVRKYVDSLK